MSNRKKPPKPTTNLFQCTFSQKNKYSSSLLILPESKYYRKQLEPLLGAVVKIECDQFMLIPDVVDRKPCCRILLQNADVVKVPTGRGLVTPIRIQHIWTLIDDGWAERNDLPSFSKLSIKGFLYLYNRNGKKNIGLQTLSARPIKETIEMNQFVHVGTPPINEHITF